MNTQRRQRLRRELQAFLLLTTYFTLFLGSFTLYRRIILAESDIAYLHYGIALIEAAVLAKLLLIGDAMGLGHRFRRGPLALNVVLLSGGATGFILLAGVVEQLIRALVRGRMPLETLSSLPEQGPSERLARTIVLIMALLPLLPSWRSARRSDSGDCGCFCSPEQDIPEHTFMMAPEDQVRHFSSGHRQKRARKFLIGVGSQRAGSTLLHRVLDQSAAQLFMHPIKELHYFDSLFSIRAPGALKQFSRKQLERLKQQHGPLNQECLSTLSRRERCEIRASRMLASQTIRSIDYLDLFRPCVRHYEWLGESTPEYMLMSPSQLTTLKNTLKGRVCAILLARNPLRRFLSAFKLRHTYLRPPGEPLPGNQELLEDLKTILRNRDGWLACQIRYNAYADAIHTYTDILGRDFMFFSLDDLVLRTDSVLATIMKVTGLEISPVRAKQVLQSRINETGLDLHLDAEAE